MGVKKDLKVRKSSVFHKMAVSYIALMVVAVLVTGGIWDCKRHRLGVCRDRRDCLL